MTKISNPNDNNNDDNNINADNVSIKLTDSTSSTSSSSSASSSSLSNVVQHSDIDMVITALLSFFLFAGIINTIITLRVNNNTNIIIALVFTIVLFSVIPSILFMLEVSQIRCFGTKLNCLELIVTRQLANGASNMLIIILASICGCDLLRLLPYQKNDYSIRNSGFPTFRLFQFCFWFTLLHHSVTLGIAIIIITSDLNYYYYSRMFNSSSIDNTERRAIHIAIDYLNSTISIETSIDHY